MKSRDIGAKDHRIKGLLLAAGMLMVWAGGNGFDISNPYAWAGEPYIAVEDLFSYESGNWNRGTSSGMSAAFYGGAADTAQWIVWWGAGRLSSDADDFETGFTFDTTASKAGAVDSMRFASLNAYPIVYDPAGSQILNHPQAVGQVLWEKPVALYETTTGRAMTAISFHRDSTYVAHSATWWSGMNVLGALIRGITSVQVDSFYVEKVWDQYLHR